MGEDRLMAIRNGYDNNLSEGVLVGPTSEPLQDTKGFRPKTTFTDVYQDRFYIDPQTGVYVRRSQAPTTEGQLIARFTKTSENFGFLYCNLYCAVSFADDSEQGYYLEWRAVEFGSGVSTSDGTVFT